MYGNSSFQTAHLIITRCLSIKLIQREEIGLEIFVSMMII